MKHYFVISITLVGLLACRKQAPPAPKQHIKATELPRISVTAKAKALYTYYDTSKSRFDTVTTITDVPATSRGWVRVVNLATRPEQRRDHELVYVADLRKEKRDHSFPYVVMSRRAFELAAQNRAYSGASAPQGSKGQSGAPAKGAVVLYSTSWCSACRAARRWLTDNAIPFEEKDIEKDTNAAAELMQKAQEAGISPSGVPVLDVRGTLVQGFDPQRIKSLLGGKR